MPSDPLPPSRWLAGLAIALLACGACRNDVDLSEKRFKCEDDSDCFAGHACVDVPNSDGKACAPVVGGMEGDRADAGPAKAGCVDFDGDGHPQGNCGGMTRDCADTDDQIHPGAEERCNGLDDDCNGQVDEECECTPQETQSCFSGAPGSQGTGVCTAGEQTCQVRGTWGRCEGMQRSTAERCDGKDNDCDGRVDENLVQQCGTREGGCDFGEQRCVDGEWGECTIPSAPDLEEECGDEQDNDCDGVAEEGCPCTFPGATGEEGVCAGVTRNEMGECERPMDFVSTPTTEQGHCDDKDNDCDGIVDEQCPCNYEGKSAGVCAGLRIDRSTGECPEPPDYNATDDEAAAGLCDGNDNDCDGTADENCSCSQPGEREEFYSGPAGTEGVGICQPGIRQCTDEGTWATEQPEQTPKMEEMCNNTDDDCDGQEDEDLERECYSGPQGTAGVGICQKGTERCISGNWLGGCRDERTPVGDREQDCTNNRDDDCDGETDEGCACNYAQSSQGVCGQSQTEDGGACGEPADYESTEASCADNTDNDCDGQIDYDDRDCQKAAGSTCTSNDECLSGECDDSTCSYRIFVSSQTFDGDLGGISGADQTCNTLAGNENLGGNWEAVLSTSGTDLKSKLTLDAAVVRLDGTTVIANGAPIWQVMESNNPVLVDESGQSIPTCTMCDDDLVWTGTSSDGTATNDTCNDWQSGSPAPQGTLGDGGDTDEWLYDDTSPRRCHNRQHIYCIDGA